MGGGLYLSSRRFCIFSSQDCCGRCCERSGKPSASGYNINHMIISICKCNYLSEHVPYRITQKKMNLINFLRLSSNQFSFFIAFFFSGFLVSQFLNCLVSFFLLPISLSLSLSLHSTYSHSPALRKSRSPYFSMSSSFFPQYFFFSLFPIYSHHLFLSSSFY